MGFINQLMTGGHHPVGLGKSSSGSHDWFQGQVEPEKKHDLHGEIDGFRLRFSQENQSIE